MPGLAEIELGGMGLGARSDDKHMDAQQVRLQREIEQRDYYKRLNDQDREKETCRGACKSMFRPSYLKQVPGKEGRGCFFTRFSHVAHVRCYLRSAPTHLAHKNTVRFFF